jgi:diaminohydroxyphosphoribosylaminopyrimidine deaminase/5-amino-6-(5-phosphoribosylamino)uracil reductase
VVPGVLAAEARRLNAPFFTLIERARPFVTMKVAISLDGGIAGKGGAPVALTGAAAGRLVHRERAEVDALAVGSGTILADDPRLTARGAHRFRPLTRVVFDTRLRTPPGARLFSTLDAGPVIIVTAERTVSAEHARAEALRASGAELLLLSVPTVETALRELARRGISSLIVEGGASLHRACWHAGVVDRVQLFVADRVIGPHRVPWLEEPVMSAARIGERTARPVGVDILLEGYVHRAH